AVGLFPQARTNKAEPVQPPLQTSVRTADDWPIQKRLVNSVFQSLTSLEARNLGSGDVDRLTSLRVAASACSTFLDSESTKTNQYHGITSREGTSDGFNHCIQRAASNSFRDISRCSDGIDQFRLVHSKSPFFC